MRILLFAASTDEYAIPAFWDMVTIAEHLAEKVHVLTSFRGEIPDFRGGKVIKSEFKMLVGERIALPGLFGRILRYLEHELRTFLHIYRLRKEVDIILSFQSVGILAMLLSWLLRRRSISYVGGDPKETLFKGSSAHSTLLATVSILLWRAHIHLATVVVAISPRIMRDFTMRKKIYYAYVRFLDERFRVIKPLEERGNILGYVGRVEDEKGVMKLAAAFSLVRQRVDADFLIVGDGSLLEQMKRMFGEKEILQNATFTGWVSNVHEHLNEMKLLVLPSKTEGFPSVVLEAMACGTPIIVTQVGDIHSIVKDGFSGFILKSAEPPSMSKKIVDLLSKPEQLSEVAANAHNWVKTNYSPNQIVSQWRHVLNALKTDC